MLTQPVSAMSNEALYDMCKPYVDKGYEMADVNDSLSIYSQGLCQKYIIALIEQLSEVCKIQDWAKEYHPDKPDLILDVKIAAGVHGTSADLSNLNAVIQLFVNYAAANSTKWEYRPDAGEWLTQEFP